MSKDQNAGGGRIVHIVQTAQQTVEFKKTYTPTTPKPETSHQPSAPPPLRETNPSPPPPSKHD